jgi:hypothetical protein
LSSVAAKPPPGAQLPKSLAVRASQPRDWLEWPLFFVAIAGGALLLFHLTRNLTFGADEWMWVTGRRGGGLHNLLTPYNDHLALAPLLIYKALFATAGLNHYGAYRLIGLAGHLLCVTLAYLYVRRRVGWLLALAAAVVVMLLGPGWQDILWPFQIAWTLALSAGIGALLMLERRSRGGDIAASLLIALALASTSLGLAVAAGTAVQIALSRRRWRDGWIVLGPLVLYGIWWLVYGETNTTGNVFSVVQFTAESIADSFSAVLGLSGASVLNPSGTLLAFGAPIAVAAVVGFMAARRRLAVSLGAAPALVVILLTFLVLAGTSRSLLQPPSTSRYLYVEGVLLVLIAAELIHGVELPAVARVLIVLAALLASFSNLGVMRTSAAYLRSRAAIAKAEVGALNLSQSLAAPSYIATAFPGYPFVAVKATDLYAAEREFGSPGFTASQLASGPAPARSQADTEMVTIRQLRLRPGPIAGARRRSGAQLPVDPGSSGRVTSRGTCLIFQSEPVGPGEQSQLQLTVPRRGLAVAAPRGTASVGVRRFGDRFLPVGSAPDGTTATLLIAPDGLAQPWHLQLSSTGRASVCPIA